MSQTILEKLIRSYNQNGLIQDLIDDTVRVELNSCLKMLEENIFKLEMIRKDQLKGYQKEDLEGNKKVVEAIKVVLDYYHIPGS
jgi:hypothetical protein